MRSFGYAQDDKMGYAIVGRGLAPVKKPFPKKWGRANMRIYAIMLFGN